MLLTTVSSRVLARSSPPKWEKNKSINADLKSKDALYSQLRVKYCNDSRYTDHQLKKQSKMWVLNEQIF